MKPEISEFSYGYGVTEAFAERWRPHLTAAPAYPSLLYEGRPGGGYDVRLERRGIPLFLQFKLSDYMVRSYVREARRGLLTVPFYRMYLQSPHRSNQHRMLLDLEARGQRVRYVAPMFHRTGEFNDAYQNRQILQRSIFLRPSAIGPLSAGSNHHIAFRGRHEWYLLSDPQWSEEPLDDETFGNEILSAVEQFGANALTEDALGHLKTQMVEIVQRWRPREQPAYELSFRPEQGEDALRQVGYLSRTFFGSECIIVWRPQK